MKNGPKFDINDGDIIVGNGNLGFDSEGNMMIRVGNNTMMDTRNGDIHFTSGGFNNHFGVDTNKIWDEEDD